MRGMHRWIALLGVVALLAGCAGKSRSYRVVVRNDSPRSVTVWLTKNGPPDEPGWKSPETIALETLGSDERVAGVIIPPGKAGETGTVKGHFPEGVDAVLRVYLGQLAFDDLLAINRDSPNRIDVVLTPGTNELTVRDKRGATVVERNGQPVETP
jgi:hypothetical protein